MERRVVVEVSTTAEQWSVVAASFGEAGEFEPQAITADRKRHGGGRTAREAARCA
jgi:hypothetical protein